MIRQYGWMEREREKQDEMLNKKGTADQPGHRDEARNGELRDAWGCFLPKQQTRKVG